MFNMEGIQKRHYGWKGSSPNGGKQNAAAAALQAETTTLLFLLDLSQLSMHVQDVGMDGKLGWWGLLWSNMQGLILGYWMGFGEEKWDESSAWGRKERTSSEDERGGRRRGFLCPPLSPEVGARPWVCCGAKEAPKVSDKWAQVVAVNEGERGGWKTEYRFVFAISRIYFLSLSW